MQKDGFEMKKILPLLAISGVMSILSACTYHEKSNFEFMPDMGYSPGYKGQEGMENGMRRQAPQGTIPRGYTAVGYTSESTGTSYPEFEDAEAAGRALKNPIARTKEHLLRGQKIFNSNCTACHGSMGEGDSAVVKRGYPMPPSLQSDKVRGWADGSIFHVITRGQNLMPSYASQIKPEDRWKVVHYVRAIQRAKKPTAQDLQAYEQDSH
jgi:mono/diheme cytochrome c family protein